MLETKQIAPLRVYAQSLSLKKDPLHAADGQNSPFWLSFSQSIIDCSTSKPEFVVFCIYALMTFGSVRTPAREERFIMLMINFKRGNWIFFVPLTLLIISIVNINPFHESVNQLINCTSNFWVLFVSKVSCRVAHVCARAHGIQI